MVRLFPLFLFIFCLVSCQEEDCSVNENLVAPEGLTVDWISTLPAVEDVHQMQFLSRDLGFMLVVTEGDTIAILKTVNGGSSWDFINPPAGTYPNDLFFLNESTGFLTQYTDLDYPSLWKTSDGGATWEELYFPEFTGRMWEFKQGQDGLVYAKISVLQDSTHIVRSEDAGESWQRVVSFPSRRLERYQVVGDQIYMVTTDKEIITTDLEGNDQQVSYNRAFTNNSSVDLEIIDKKNWVLTSFYSAVKTDDAGVTWTQIFDAPSRIIHFPNPNQGILLLNTGYCGDNPIERGVLATTDNAGITWQESAPVESLVDRLVATQHFDGANLLLLKDWTFSKYQLYLVE
jgi:hypothetical protein